MNRLEGSRFRFLNEKLYTISSNKAKELFTEDIEAFDAYHKGYRLQVCFINLIIIKKLFIVKKVAVESS